MAVPSSTDIEKTAQMLSCELAAGRELRRFAKEANWVETLKSRWSGLSPTAKGLLAGTAGGAVLGGLSSLGREKEERQPLQSALTGGLAGGLLGGGLGFAAQYGGLLPGKSKPLFLRQGGASAKALDPKVIARMTPEELAAIDPKQLASSSLEALNAVKARQQQWIQQAHDQAASPLARVSGALGVTAAGAGLAEKARKGYRTRTSLFGGPSDLVRGWEALDAKARANMPMSLQDAEELARKIVQDAKQQQYPSGPQAGGWATRLGNRLRRVFGVPEIAEFPDIVKQVPKKKNPAKFKTVTQRDPRETVRRLLQEGRHARLSRFPKLRTAGYGLAGLAALLAAYYSAKRSQRAAGEQMARRLKVQ